MPPTLDPVVISIRVSETEDHDTAESLSRAVATAMRGERMEGCHCIVMLVGKHSGRLSLDGELVEQTHEPVEDLPVCLQGTA